MISLVTIVDVKIGIMTALEKSYFVNFNVFADVFLT